MGPVLVSRTNEMHDKFDEFQIASIDVRRSFLAV
jgi:hypothetical protein